LHFARFSLSLQHDVRNTIMDEIEKNNQIVVTASRQLSQKIGDGSDDPQNYGTFAPRVQDRKV